ncbi:MAG: carboxypeptidase M32 [Spirochaetes bacterium]|nr:carboxypeptidase M32 [Spirochaetota bacterium]
MNSKGWKALRKIDHEVYLLKHVSSLLGWDQETYMPSRGIEERAEQISLLETLIHEKITSTATKEALEHAKEELEIENEPSENGLFNPLTPIQRVAFLREWNRKLDRASRIPKSLVSRISYATSVGQAKWAQARKEASFELFKPYLQEILILTRELAAALGYKDTPYDPLLDEYEPGMTCEILSPLFQQLQKNLAPMLEEIITTSNPEDPCLHLPFPKEAQEDFGKRILQAIGFPWDRARLDVSVHPFTSTLGKDDVRITTRYNPTYFPTAIFGIIHEAGHGLYDLGFGEEIRGTILAEGVSLGIHESQSRFWENFIGRHRAFWTYWFPILRKDYLPALEQVPFDTFLKSINRVCPSLIRVEADEVTYPLHILLRYNLEKALIEDTLSLSDLPAAWNDGMEELLGIRPSHDGEGVLQDIHWSMGSFGYFPTYALGTLYAAQFFSSLLKQHPHVLREVERGEYGTVVLWLREHVHVHGKVFSAEELCRKISGSPLDSKYFLQYVREKYLSIPK